MIKKITLEYALWCNIILTCFCFFHVLPDDHSVRKTLKAGAILAEKNAVVATGGSQAIGSKAQVGQLVGANANVGDATIQFRTGNTSTFKRMYQYFGAWVVFKL